MKEFIQAFESRVKSPVFGYTIFAFIVINWKALFTLFVSKASVVDRISSFENLTSTQTLLFYPVLVGVIGAMIYPWISYVFISISRKPNELKQVVNLIQENKLLIKKKEFEKSRTELLDVKEQELLRQALTDKEIKSIDDDELRISLEKKVEKLRSDTEKAISSNNKTKNPKTNLVDIYMELGRLQEKAGSIEDAEDYFLKAREVARERNY